LTNFYWIGFEREMGGIFKQAKTKDIRFGTSFKKSAMYRNDKS